MNAEIVWDPATDAEPRPEPGSPGFDAYPAAATLSPMPTQLRSSATPADLTDAASVSRIEIFRWVICGLLFLATTISYVDRMVFSILAPELQQRFHISEIQYGYLGSAFTMFYSSSMLLAGPLLDRVGTRLGLLLAMVLWSTASMLHGACRSAAQFFIARAALGVTESPAFPGATKGIAEWFPSRQRATAMGVINCGSNIGVILAVLLVPWLMTRWGWQSVFVTTGTLGFLWAALWIPIYRNAPIPLSISKTEAPAARLRWRALLRYRQTWAICLGKFFTDPSWWFYINWLPKFMHEHHSLDIVHLGPPLLIIYVMADAGSICGGSLSSVLLARGWSVNAARKTAMLICAIFALPLIFAPYVQNVWIASVLIGLATAAHQGFSSNLYVLCSDAFPSTSVSSIAGLAGTCGYAGAMLMSALIGYILTWTHQSYNTIFAIAGVSYLVAIAAVHLVAPSFKAAG